MVNQETERTYYDAVLAYHGIEKNYIHSAAEDLRDQALTWLGVELPDSLVDFYALEGLYELVRDRYDLNGCSPNGLLDERYLHHGLLHFASSSYEDCDWFIKVDSGPDPKVLCAMELEPGWEESDKLNSKVRIICPTLSTFVFWASTWCWNWTSEEVFVPAAPDRVDEALRVSGFAYFDFNFETLDAVEQPITLDEEHWVLAGLSVSRDRKRYPEGFFLNSQNRSGEDILQLLNMLGTPVRIVGNRTGLLNAEVADLLEQSGFDVPRIQGPSEGWLAKIRKWLPFVKQPAPSHYSIYKLEENRER